jgi:hypothetical protein
MKESMVPVCLKAKSSGAATFTWPNLVKRVSRVEAPICDDHRNAATNDSATED